MKPFKQKLSFLVSILVIFNVSAQEITPEMFQNPLNTGANQTVAWSLSYPNLLAQFDGGLMGAFYDLNNDGIINVGEIVGLGEISEWQNNFTFFAIALWGDDSSTPEKDGLSSGDIPIMAILTTDQQIIHFSMPNFGGYVNNGIENNLFFGDLVGPPGCTNYDACNSMFIYDQVDYINDGSCYYPEQHYDCYGYCINDSDGDGVCNELEILGCQDSAYLEYNPSATEDDGSCFTEKVYGCTYSDALNFDPLANVNDGSCEVEGCTNNYADNYDWRATIDDGSCVKSGCTDQSASNAMTLYDNITYTDDGSCEYPGCTNPIAINYQDWANIDDGSCLIEGCVNEYADNFNSDANVDDGSCSRLGCADLNACNTLIIYENINYIDDGSCDYPEQYYDCDGNCLNDNDGDGVCDELEIPGCQNEGYIEFNALATDEDGSCEFTWQEGYLNIVEFGVCSEIIINIEEGWNIFGYTSAQIVDIAEVMAPYEDKIYIIKDNNGSQYWPANNYNGIGDFTPGGGYQIKAYESFSISFEN